MEPDFNIGLHNSVKTRIILLLLLIFFSSGQYIRIEALASEIEWCSGNLSYKSEGNDTLFAERNRVIGLVSYPGSGNTWLRYLLQQATGLITGSEYIDGDLRKNGFPGEGVVNSRVLVVKTHEYEPHLINRYERVILLVRNPKDAILAAFNTKGSGHMAKLNVNWFYVRGGWVWRNFVNNGLSRWQDTNIFWGFEFPRKVRIVLYDDLVNKTGETLREVLKFIEHPIDEKLLECTLDNKNGLFKRAKSQDDFEPYTADLLKTVIAITKMVYDKLGIEETS